MSINLLPEKEKKELKMEEIRKKIFVLLVFVLIFLIILIFISFCLKLYISPLARSFQAEIKNKKEVIASPQFQNFKQTIIEANLNLSKIEKFYENQIFLAPILEKLSNLTPKTIYLTNFSFKKIRKEKKQNKKETKKKIEIFAEIHVSGSAKNREDLFFFKKALEAEQAFEDVYFSPSSWVKPRDIEFSLSFKFKPQK